MTDPYETLGIPRDADAHTIKRAFRNRAKSTHPDAGGTQEDFTAAQSAYALLANPARRARYDRTGRADAEQDNTQARILQLATLAINTALQEAVNSFHDPLTLDILARAKANTMRHIAGLKKEQANLRRQQSLYENAAKKFSRPQGGGKPPPGHARLPGPRDGGTRGKTSRRNLRLRSHPGDAPNLQFPPGPTHQPAGHPGRRPARLRPVTHPA